MLHLKVCSFSNRMRSRSSSSGSSSRRVVLVTGCSRGGIGHALCLALAAKGCVVYATARKLGLLDGLQQAGCICLELDVTHTAAAQQVVQRIIAEAGRIDILVNNAGSIIKGWAVETPMQDVRQLMEVNFFAVLALTNAVAPHMIQQRRGLIVNISSSCAYAPVPQASAYTASKFAIRGYTDAVRVELAPFGVHAMLVAPGFIRTNLVKSDTTVGLRDDSPYNQFTHATQQLTHNDLTGGISGWGATDPAVFAQRLARVVLSANPPRHYQDGWMWQAFYWLGNYAPLWVSDWLHRLRLGLW